jgi:hypothetical protein
LFIKLRDECRPRVFRNGMLRKLYRPEREEELGGWIKLHKEEFGDFWSGMGLACGRGIRNAWRILSEKSERKKN